MAKDKHSGTRTKDRASPLALAEAHERAVEQLQAGAHDEAERTCAEILAQAPGRAPTLHLLGVILGAAGKPEQAEAPLRRALAGDPKNAAYRRTLAGLLNNLGLRELAARRPDLATARFEAAVALDPEQPQPLNNLGLARLQQGRPAEALAPLGRALALQPGYAQASYNLGLALEGCGKLAEAASAFEQAAAQQPRFAEAHSNLGNVLYALQRFDEAAAAFTRAVALRASFAEALAGLGLAQFRLQRLDEAAASLARAHALAPDAPGVGGNLGSVLLMLDRRGEATEVLQACLARNPDDPRALHLLAAATGVSPPRAPRDYVRDLFDGYAPRFDHHLVEVLGYGVPERVRRSIDELHPGPLGSLLDIGCGTGLAAAALAGRYDRAVGLDLSPRMADQARARGLYERVLVGDAVELMASLPAGFGLLVATDVLIYLGELAPLFGAARRCAAEGAWFVFSAERAEGQADYALGPRAHYAHAPAYLERLAREHRFDLVRREPLPIRKHEQSWVEGDLYFLRARG